MIVGGSLISTALSHNLDQLDTSIAFDKATLDLMATRAGLNQPLVQAGDSLGLILKSTPGPGTATGAGGYMTFYIPPGTQVEKTEYGRPTVSGGFAAIPLKGPAIMAIGDGSVGSATTPGLVGLTLGPNAAGVTAPATSATGVHNGTLAGVYGDVGIFYSTDPKTVWQSFVNSGGYDRNTGTSDNVLTNNRGEARVPITKWDAEQLIGFGLSSPTQPILDPNGRGNSPWGMGSAVAGPQSGYQWAFDRDIYLGNPANLKASIVTGPWNRIQYPGSTISKDQVGLKSTTLGYGFADASSLGAVITPVTPLPATLNWTDNTSPKAVRISYGGLVLGQSEYARVQLKILAAPGEPNSPFDANGCFFMNTDTFGGDAGGEQGGKDHLWRYYDPTTQTVNPCAMLQKQFAKTPLAPGELSYFELAVINTGTAPMTNVVVTDPIPAGLTYVSATPAPSSTSPLKWTIGTVPSQGFVKIRVNVTATGSGTIFNTATMTSSAGTVTAMDSVDVGIRSILEPTKSVNPSTVAPGATVTYSIGINNIGTGSNGTPLVVTDVLPSGFTYSGFVSAQLNGASAPSSVVTVNAADPTRPIYTISQGIQPGKKLILNFTANVSPTQLSGTYGNTVSMNYEGKTVTSGSLAPVTVGGGRIGDTVWRDWDNDGVQDPVEEGLPGMTVRLYASDGTTLLQTTTTDASGKYVFAGLNVGTYVVKASPPAGYTQSYDADGIGSANQSTVTLGFNENNSTQDFGYLPGGTGSIGDTVFEDLANDGALSPGDPGLSGINVDLFEDSNGNGIVDLGDSLIATTTTNGSGSYLFSGLATGLNYIAAVNTSDPGLSAYFAPDSYQPSTPSSMAVANLTGSNLTADFGFWKIQPGSIGDQIFFDANGDGIYSLGVDSPMVGVIVKLYLDGALVRSVTSAVDGTYLFNNIGPGSYSAVVDPLSEGVPSGYSSSVSQYDVTLTAGQNYLGADFPFVPLISKTVDKSYVQTGQTLTFGVNVDYAGSQMLDNVMVRDFVPQGTTYSSAGQGGGLVTFSPTAGIPGTDAGSSGSATVSVTAQSEIDDTWLDENSPTTNYGNTTDIRVDPETSRPEHALVRFTLPAGIPDDAVVTSATLKLTKLSGDIIDISAHQADNSWTEGQASWENRQSGTTWDMAGGDYMEDPADPVISSGAATGDRTWQVAHIVQNWLAGDPNNGFLLKHPLEDLGNNANVFASSENGTAASRPTLTITYTSTARPATSNTITASPSVVAIGSPITVTMTVQSSQGVANVIPSTLQVHGGGATVSGPTPASVNLTANTPANFTWTVIPTAMAELTFSATAGNGTVGFISAESNGVLASPGGQSQYVAWNLGSNDAGTAGITATGKNLYAFRGADALSFWIYNTETGLWNSPLDPPDAPVGVTVNSGGAMANDGVRYIYALRGDSTRVFLRYDTSTDTWSDAAVADLPGTTDKVVLKGGSLVYLNGFVYAFIGNDSRQVWRYSVAGNSWTQLSNAPGTVNNGAGLTTNGTNIYATQGDGKKGFWRYNVASNTWTALAPFADNFGDGGGLVFANGAIYVMSGNAKKIFRRYNIGSNTWTTLAPTLANIDDGAAIAYNGIAIYVLSGKSNLFYQYNLATNTWVAQANTQAAIGWGGALSFMAVGNVSQTTASASPTMVTGVTQVSVTMMVTSEDAVNNITPAPPTYTSTSGITATFGSSVLVSADDDISGSGDPVIYRWIATVSPGANPGEITFITNSSLGAASTTNSVIVSPQLTFVSTVGTSPPGVIENTAFVADSTVTIPSTPSNTTQTATGASIGDFVWADRDGDGVQDFGEPGLSGVRVFIDQDADGLYDVGEPTDVTDSSGIYRIFGLTAGTYAVQLDLSSIRSGYRPSTQPLQSVVLVTSSTQYSNADFGLRPQPNSGGALSGSIGDTLWIDADEDGIVDGSETLLGGIAVNLYQDSDNSGAIDAGDIFIGTQTTDANGHYLFSDLYEGNYLIDVIESDNDMPVGLEIVSGGTNGAGLHDVTLAAGVNFAGADFGYNHSGRIGDYVWYDLNGNTVQNDGIDGGPVPNAVVTLYQDSNSNGSLEAGEPILAFTTTNVSGAYLFDNLPVGNYIVKVEEQEVLAPPSSPFAGQPGRMQASTGTKKAVSLAPGQDYVSADFGFLEVAKVEGHVFYDTNGNGVLDPGETALPNITVNLIGTDQNGVPVSMTATTDSNGQYKFLPPAGTYTVSYDTGDVDIPVALGTHTTPVSFLFSIASGNELENLNFGLDNTGSIGDTVFANPNSNSTQDPGESGLAFVLVNLYTDASRTQLLDSKVTDANGNYVFTGLADGVYYIDVVTDSLPSGYSTAPTADPDATKDSLGAATITNGNSVQTLDFGYTFIIPTFTITGTIFHDIDANGSPIVPSEQLAGVSIRAEVDTNADGNFEQTFITTTNGNGLYTFAGIPTGANVIVSVIPSTLGSPAYVQTVDPDATMNHATQVTNLTANATGVDFGYVLSLSSIAGSVVKGDGDGLAEIGEPGQVGVIVTLIYAGIDGIPGTGDDETYTMPTNANGDYSFNALNPGNYSIVTTVPIGFHPFTDRDGTNPNSISLALGVGQNMMDQDFEYQAGSISNYVWNDANGDGLQDANELPISGVRVYVDINDDGNYDLGEPNSITNASGFYGINGLSAGTFIVRVDHATLPAGTTQTFDLDGLGTPDKTTVILEFNQDRNDVDFGYQGNASIGDYVWNDSDGDGIQDGNELPLPGVVVFLDLDTDGVKDTFERSAITSASGAYTIDGLIPGSYTVAVDITTLPPATPPTYDLDGIATPNKAVVTLSAGQTLTTIDFGYQPPTHAISGQVRNDLDADGELTDPDSGLPNVTITLFNDPNGDGDHSDGIILATTLTNVSGVYSFGGLSDGNYVVVETNSDGALSTADAVDPNDDKIPVSMAGANVTQRDFLDVDPPSNLHTISGTVYQDGSLNDDAFSSDDTVVPAVTISLYSDVDGDGLLTLGFDILIGTDTTNLNGGYSFSDLPDGNYLVLETDPVGAISESDAQGSLTDNLIAVVVNGMDEIANDFLDDQVTQLAITGQVRNDLDGDGNPLDPDTGINGVVITLYTDPNGDGDPSDGIPLGNFITGLNGRYAFQFLPPGSYVVEETDPVGANSTFDPSGSLTDNRINVPLTTSNVGSRDFLDTNAATASVSGFVYDDGIPDDNIFSMGDSPMVGVQMILIADLNHNGVYDPGEPAVDLAVTTLVTDGHGFYQFTNLASGDYIVYEVDPSDATSENDVVGSPTDNEVAVTLIGTDVTGRNFLDDGALLGGISGSVYQDVDLGGTLTSGDQAIPGVIVSLYTDPDGDGNPADGLLVSTTVTDISGQYNFSQLVTGSYVVVEIDPSGATSTGDVQGLPTDNFVAVAVEGNVVTSRDFFDAAPDLSRISGFVYDDGLPNDDAFGAGDGPVAGIIISLFKDSNIDGMAQSDEFLGRIWTSITGEYQFSNLPDGSYLVVESNPSGAVSENDTQGAPTDDLIALTLAGADSTGNNFLDDGVQAFSISGQVRDDFDVDGVLTDADSPVGGVTLKLYADLNSNGAIDSGEPILGTTQTNTYGNYLFGNLTDGTYLVQEIDPPSAISTADTGGSLTDNLIPVVIVGASSTGNDFLDAVDPSGYIYNAATGQLVPGGILTVTGPAPVNMLMNGSTGQYSYITDGTPGSYTMSYTPPAGYMIDPTRPVTAASFDPTGLGNPVSLGSGENPTQQGYLLDYSGASNPYYLTFVLASGDPIVINNNIPLVQFKPTNWVGWQYQNRLGGNNGAAQNPDGDSLSNLLEYVTCSNPGGGIANACNLYIVVQPTGRIDLKLRRVKNLTDVTFTLEGAGQLLLLSPTSFAPITNLTSTVMDNGDGTETVTFADLESAGAAFADGDGFFRIKVELDSNRDNITDATDYLGVVGYTEVEHAGDIRATNPLVTHQCTTFSMPYQLCEIFGGVVDGNDASSLDLTTSVGIGDLSSILNPTKSYYIEVINGPLEGHRFDVDTANTSSSSLSIDIAAGSNTKVLTPGLLSGSRIILREHHTISSLFPPSTLKAGNSPTNSDYIVSVVNNSWVSYWLLDMGVNGNRWVMDGDVNLVDYGNRIIPPGEGIYFHRRGLSISMVRSGEVRTNQMVIPLQVGKSLIGSGYPLDQSYNSRGMTVPTGFHGSIEVPHADQVLHWVGDTIPGRTYYTTDWLLDGGTPYQYWTSAENSSIISRGNTKVFSGTRAAVHISIYGLPTYIVPAQWSTAP